VYCHKCNAFNDDNAERCVRCGHILQELREIPEPEEVQPGDAPAPTQTRAPGAGSPRGGAPRRRALRESIPTYLGPAILSCLWCIPFGVVAIVYAAQVGGRLDERDQRGAHQYSANARLWCWLSFGLGLAFYVSATIYSLMSTPEVYD
jgi:hypothetical protein